MIQIRKSSERGYADHGWLKSYHSFSFADYFDPAHMGFGPLRVINEDFIEGGAGFGTHGHQDMEIITYPLDGAIAHKDSTGSSGVILPYEVQKMTAGSGIRHSEFNHLKDRSTHLLQIWIVPNATGLPPSYEQRNFEKQIQSGDEVLIISPTGAAGSIQIHQDVLIRVKKIRPNESWDLKLDAKRIYWIQVVRGSLVSRGTHAQTAANEQALLQGDALSVRAEEGLSLVAQSDSEVLLFDMLDLA